MNKGIYMNTEYLEKFFRNLLLGESNALRNRYCHIKYNGKVAVKSQKSSDNVATNEKSSDIILKRMIQSIILQREKLQVLQLLRFVKSLRSWKLKV